MTCEEIRLEYQMLLDSHSNQLTKEMTEHVQICADCSQWMQEIQFVHSTLLSIETESAPASLPNKLKEIHESESDDVKTTIRSILPDIGIFIAGGLALYLYNNPSQLNTILCIVLSSILVAVFISGMTESYFFPTEE